MAQGTLKVIVIDGGKGSGGFEIGDKKNPSLEKWKKSSAYQFLNANTEIRSAFRKSVTPTTAFAVESALRLSVQTARSAFNYYITDIGRQNGDSNLQSRIGRQMEITTDAMSVAGGALSGAASGSMFGPWGAAIGAVVGTASAGISLGFKYAERERTYAHQMFEQSNSQAVQLSRANYTAFTGRAR